MEKKIKISIKIGEKTYPMNISPALEQEYREGAKELQNVYLKYKNKYSGMPVEDVLAMAAFDVAVKYIKLKETKENTSFFVEFSDIVNTLKDYLEAQ